MLVATTLLALQVLTSAPRQDALPVLPVGEVVRGVIEEGDPEVHTEALDARRSSAPPVARVYRIEVAEPGPGRVELRSWHFDAYLVLRDAEGEVLAEDDDGLLGTHARVAIPELEVGTTLVLEVCALKGERGPFELALVQGAPPAPSRRERAAAERTDLERLEEAVREIEGREGPESEVLAAALSRLGGAHVHRDQYGDARSAWERALAIRERVLGPEHPETGASLNNVALVLRLQGDLAAARPYQERALALCERVLGPQHPNTASSLSNLAALLWAQGELDAARPYLERALAIREQVLGPEHPKTASSLNDLALMSFLQGELDAARPLFERALAMQALGPEHPRIAKTLGYLGVLLWRQGRLDASRAHLERALAIQEEILGPEHPETRDTLGSLGSLLWELGTRLRDRGELDVARLHYERALAVSEQVFGPVHPIVAGVLNDLGLLLEEQGELAAARSLFERALSVCEGLHAAAHLDTAAVLDNLARLLRGQGELATARSHLERALAISEQVLGPQDPSVARLLNDLGGVLEEQGELAAARPLFERALAVYERVRGAEHPDTATALNSLAALLWHQGELATARSLLERALAISERALGPEDPRTAALLNNLAKILVDEGDLAAARARFERALAITEQVLGPDHRNTADVLNNLAQVLQSQGELAMARPLLERALAVRERVQGAEHPDTAMTLNNLAVLLRDQGELGAARPLLERAVAISETVLGPAHPATAEETITLARLYADTGELDRARDLVFRSAPGRRAHLQRVLGGLTEAERFQYLAKLRWQLDTVLSLGVSDDPSVLAECYGSLLTWKGRIARMLVASREQLARSLDDEQRDLVARLRALQARLSRLLSESPLPDRAELLAALYAERNALELELTRELEGAEVAPDVSLADVRGGLPRRSAVLDFFVQPLYRLAEWSGRELVRPGIWSEDHVIAWIVTPEGEGPPLVRLDLGPAAVLEGVCRRFLEGLVARRGLSTSEGREPDAADELRELLWDPVAPFLDDVEIVFVSPDEFLGTLPLEALQLTDGSFLVEHLGLVYLQDVGSLARSARRPMAEYDSLLAVGGVDFRLGAPWEAEETGELVEAASDRGSFTDYWGRLPATRYESQVVADMHEDAFGEDGRRLLLQGDAPTEERLKHELERYSVLHLATHGFFQPEGTPSMWESALSENGKREMRMSEEAAYLVGRHPGLLSGLVCAGANRTTEERRDDGYLTAEEVGWLDLTRVELVVLSACDTGLGRARSGEGLIGLRRAFRTAGAQTVVSSLWSVKDESTAELMRDFYENLWLRGMGRREALRAAQLAMLARTRMEHGEGLPSTWGAFVLSGEWR